MGYTTGACVSLAAFESHNTYSAQPTLPKDIRIMASFNKIKLADPQDDCDDALPIEVLIGADYYWKIVTMENPIRVSLHWSSFPQFSDTYLAVTDPTL